VEEEKRRASIREGYCHLSRKYSRIEAVLKELQEEEGHPAKYKSNKSKFTKPWRESPRL